MKLFSPRELAISCHISVHGSRFSPVDLPSTTSSRRPKWSACRFLGLFLCRSLLPAVLSYTDSSHLSLSKAWSPVSSDQGGPCVPVFPLLPEPWLSNCLQAESHDKSHLLCFSSCRDHSPVPSVAQCLKTAVSHILSSFLIVYCRRASLALVNPSFMTSGRNF